MNKKKTQDQLQFMWLTEILYLLIFSRNVESIVNHNTCTQNKGQTDSLRQEHKQQTPQTNHL